MMIPFKNDETGYEAWLSNNRNGFVFNHFGGSEASLNKIHHAGCSFLHRSIDEGARTRYEKICSNNLEELKIEVKKKRGDSWTFCRSCMV